MKKSLALAFAMSASAAFADASLDITIQVNNQEPVKFELCDCTQPCAPLKLSDTLTMNVELIAQDDEAATIKCTIENTQTHEIACSPVLKSAWSEPARMTLYEEKAPDCSSDCGCTRTSSEAATSLDITIVATRN